MSIALMTAAWALDLSATDKIVLLALSDHANDEGHCWPGNASLTRKTGLSERAVRMALRSLEDAGHLTCHFVTGKSTTYHIHPGTTCPRQDMPPAPRAATPAPRAPKSSRTIIKVKKATPSQPKRARKVPDLPAGVTAEQWAAFVEMRQRIRAPLTEKAKGLLLAKLQRLSDAGHPPGDVLDQSTMNSWRGIFELKGQDDARRNGPLGGNHRPQYRRDIASELLAEAIAEQRELDAASGQGDHCEPGADLALWTRN